VREVRRVSPPARLTRSTGIQNVRNHTGSGSHSPARSRLSVTHFGPGPSANAKSEQHPAGPVLTNESGRTSRRSSGRSEQAGTTPARRGATDGPVDKAALLMGPRITCCVQEPRPKHRGSRRPRSVQEHTEKLRVRFPPASDGRVWFRSGCRRPWAHFRMPRDHFRSSSAFQVDPPPEPWLRRKAVQQLSKPLTRFSWVASLTWVGGESTFRDLSRSSHDRERGAKGISERFRERRGNRPTPGGRTELKTANVGLWQQTTNLMGS
jgi:hypothetical protein